MKKSEKSATVALLLSMFGLGLFGAHRFYVGKTGSALLMMFTLGGLGVWTFVDWVTIVTQSFKDSEGAVLKFK